MTGNFSSQSVLAAMEGSVSCGGKMEALMFRYGVGYIIFPERQRGRERERERDRQRERERQRER